MNVKETLQRAGVSANAISRLEDEGMLDVPLLTAISLNELKSSCELKTSDALKVKLAFPAAVATSSAPALQTGGTGAIEVILKSPEPMSDTAILEGIKNKDESSITEARRRWGEQAVYVPAEDGSLDVPATLGAIRFFGKHGYSDRYANSAKKSVKVLTLDQLLKEECETNPLSLKVLVPGDAMAALSYEQRLLIAFAVITGTISAGADEDTIIDSLQRMTPRWKNVETDFKVAQSGDTEQFHACKRRCRRKTGEAQPISAGVERDSCGASNGVVSALNLRLTPAAEAELEEALLSCFGDFKDLSHMILWEMNLKLEHIVAQGPMNSVVFDLVAYCKRHGRVNDLVVGAYRKRPGNADIAAFVRKHKISD